MQGTTYQPPMRSRVRPMRDLILVERLSLGRETVTKGGIVMPSTLGAKAKTKPDLWRGRVLAKGPKAPPEIEIGEDVLVYTWADGDGKVLYSGTGVGAHRFFVRPGDIVCAVAPDANVEFR